MIKWFAANNLVINLDKTNIIKFITKNSAHSTLHIGYKEKYIEQTVNTKFLGLEVDNLIFVKNHPEQMIPKLTACYVDRLLVPVSNSNILKSISYA